ncbi:MAG TPA: DUF4062 domain-containing protein [Candidatus Angelobacter sp.]|jgi:hypothetical protein
METLESQHVRSIMHERQTIFLSSTWSDLEEHRKVLLFTFAKLQERVEAMEYFGALSGEPLQECLNAVRRSQVYVGVIGTRYGSKDQEGISITQREYEEACLGKKTILIYLIDEQEHPVRPMFVDTGDDARRLTQFKCLLKQHTYSMFKSPEHLAALVSVDLLKMLRNQGYPVSADDSRMFSEQLPKLLFEAGYAIGMDSHVMDLSGIWKMGDDKSLRVQDPVVREIAVAGYLATNISRGNYDILRHILTFDQKLWRLLVILIQHYGLDAEHLANFIVQCRDPMQFRLLSALIGELSLVECAEPLCRRLLGGPDLDSEFSYLRQQSTPVREVVRDALASMPVSILPMIEGYIEKSKQLRRWHQKRAFEAAARRLRISRA